MKRDFLDIYLTTFWESLISEIQTLWWSFLFDNVQDLIQSSEMQQKNGKKFFVSQSIACELISLICPY